MRHIQGTSRQQTTLLPDTLEDYVGTDNPVRVIDAFIDTLDMQALGFLKANTKITGRKPYCPSDLLKLYVYGYFNRVRSSRRLEKECHRNLEVLWLMKRLAPDFKTIANFRKQNTKAIKGACQQFVQFCRKADLLGSKLVAIDGSKFRAAASKDRVLTPSSIEKQCESIDKRIEHYLKELDKSDTQDQMIGIDSKHVEEALQKLTEKKASLNDYKKLISAQSSDNHCTTEPDAKLMRSGREGMVVGYNVQSAVEASSGLIIHHEVTDEATDNQQLQPMAEEAKEVLKVDELDVLTDAGYSNGEQLFNCEKANITTTLPPNRGTNSQGKGKLYQRSDFKFDPKNNQFTCPAGDILQYTTKSNAQKLYLYKGTDCEGCSQKEHCTNAQNRRVSRHFYEESFDRVEERLKQNPDSMTQRMAIVERPFAILKHCMDMRRFLCWGIEGARSEMGIGILSYNLKRMINEKGVSTLLEAF